MCKVHTCVRTYKLFRVYRDIYVYITHINTRFYDTHDGITPFDTFFSFVFRVVMSTLEVANTTPRMK